MCLMIIVFTNTLVFGQSPVDTAQREYKPLRLGLVAGGSTLFYAGTLTALSTVWYKDHRPTSFHLTNDNADWLQIDKLGHAYTCYFMGKGVLNAMKWTGVSRKKAIWFGGSFGVVFMTSIEVLDGHYKEWGASYMDMVANASGGLLLIGQELLFKKEIATMKFSYHDTELSKYRPGFLGNTFAERVIQDYNGQTFWLSLNLKSVFKQQKRLPGWLNLAVGYGAYGMLGSTTNVKYAQDGELIPPMERYRSYYLALDLDLTKIKTNSKLLRSTFFVLSLIKFPLPTVEFNELGETKFYPFYF